jgi:Zn-finger nucleic acid-binding protein
MSKYRLICPECSAVVITAYPEAVVWELCPACEFHIWDIYDAKMADKVIENRADSYSYKVYAS